MKNWGTFEEFVERHWAGDLGAAVEQAVSGHGLEPEEHRLIKRLLEVRIDLVQVRLLAQILMSLEAEGEES